MSENSTGSACDDSVFDDANRLGEHKSSHGHRSMRERASEKVHEQTSVHGHVMERATIFKFIGLIAFIVLIIVIVVLMWPTMKDLFSEGGAQRLKERLQDAGFLGVLALLGMQCLQVIVAFIPGEVVQLAAGLMYGPWFGALIILCGCVISSFLVYQLVRWLGAPFVRAMVSEKHTERFERFEKSGKLDITVFILFLIPGMPKDVFTYVVPMTSMNVKRFLILTTIARIPGVLASTYAAHGVSNGNLVGPIAVVSIATVLSVVGIVFRERIMNFFDRKHDEIDTDSDGAVDKG